MMQGFLGGKVFQLEVRMMEKMVQSNFKLRQFNKRDICESFKTSFHFAKKTSGSCLTITVRYDIKVTTNAFII